MSLNATGDQLLHHIYSLCQRCLHDGSCILLVKKVQDRKYPAVSAAAEPEESNGEHWSACSIKCLVPVVDP